jgi:hypothetical protein
MPLDPQNTRRFLAGEADSLATLDWMQDEFLPEVVTVLNTTNRRRRIGIYAGEKIPENERNLTDVRNRVSLIIEYELASITSQLLEDYNVPNLFCSYVVANRFPDLEIRQFTGERGLRFEVKCLQTIAEEKSANFDTLRKDLHPQTDFVVVFLWGWRYDPTDVSWDRAVYVQRAFVFHAASLALMRDWYWLNSPPDNLGGGFQGFDLRYAVNCKGGIYNEEEGNYGKLLRIWQEGFAYAPPMSPMVSRTIADYLNFKTGAITAGFDSLAHLFLPGFSGQAAVSPITLGTQRIGWMSGDICFLLSSTIGTKKQRTAVLAGLTATRVYTMTDKYAWKEYELAEGELTEIRNGKKPKRISQGQGGN